MRKYPMVFAFVLAAASTAAAQDRAAAVGVKGGVNFANLHFDTEAADVTFDRRTGFVGGLFVVVPANSSVALQLEALYTQKGAKIDENDAEGTLKLDYIDFPLLLRVSSRPSGQTSFHAFGGPSLAFQVKAHAKGTSDGEESDEDISDETEQFDLGLVFGAGVDVGRLVIDGRYAWGLSNIFKNSDFNDSGVKVKNRVFSVMAGVRF